MDRYNATLGAMCEVIEDALADGLPASDIPNLVSNVIDELEGRAELRFVVSNDAPARISEAAR